MHTPGRPFEMHHRQDFTVVFFRFGDPVGCDLHYDQAYGFGSINGPSGFLWCGGLAVEIVGEELAKVWEVLVSIWGIQGEAGSVLRELVWDKSEI